MFQCGGIVTTQSLISTFPNFSERYFPYFKIIAAIYSTLKIIDV